MKQCKQSDDSHLYYVNSRYYGMVTHNSKQARKSYGLVTPIVSGKCSILNPGSDEITLNYCQYNIESRFVVSMPGNPIPSLSLTILMTFKSIYYFDLGIVCPVFHGILGFPHWT